MTIAVDCPCGARVRLIVQAGVPTGWRSPSGVTWPAPVYACPCGRRYRALDADPWIAPAEPDGMP